MPNILCDSSYFTSQTNINNNKLAPKTSHSIYWKTKNMKNILKLTLFFN